MKRSHNLFVLLFALVLTAGCCWDNGYEEPGYYCMPAACCTPCCPPPACACPDSCGSTVTPQPTTATPSGFRQSQPTSPYLNR